MVFTADSALTNHTVNVLDPSSGRAAVVRVPIAITKAQFKGIAGDSGTCKRSLNPPFKIKALSR